jgi:hypothetical protein
VKTPSEWVAEHANCNGEAEVAAALALRDAEWRRLVEEAQTDAKNAINVGLKQIAEICNLQIERDRLKGELDDTRDALADLLTAHNRLKGELAEARLLLNDAFLPSFAEWQSAKHAFLAATPAEQAQGEAACACANCGRPDIGCMESAQVAALAKRVDALEAWQRGEWTCSAGHRHGPRETCSAPFPVPPTPESAGPGHAHTCGMVCGVDHCEHEAGRECSDPIHAVPPTPEGAK